MICYKLHHKTDDTKYTNSPAVSNNKKKYISKTLCVNENILNSNYLQHIHRRQLSAVRYISVRLKNSQLEFNLEQYLEIISTVHKH